MLFVRWEEKYSVDRLSPSLFAEDVSSKEITHDTKWDGSDWVEACARLTVSGDKVELDYSAFDHENREKGIDLGACRFTLGKAGSVEWANPGGLFEPRPDVVIEDSGAMAALEGNPKLVTHYSRERDDRLRKLKLEESEPRCEGCGDDLRTYPEAASLFEVHHRVPLAKGKRLVTTEDLAILCPTCHRAIHKRYPITVEDFAATLPQRD